MTGELHLHWEIREGSLEEVILCGGTSKMNGRLTQKQRERSLGGLWSRGSGKQEGEAFEEPKECQSCKVIGGKGSRTHGVLGTVLGVPDATPRSRHRRSRFSGEENVDCGHSAIGARLPRPHAVRTVLADPPAPPSPHPTPVDSWEVTVTFAEGQLGKGGGPSFLFLSLRGI